MTRLTRNEADTVLANWRTLNPALLQMDEDACQQLLDYEMKSETPRRRFIMRINSRLARLRAQRDREELEAKIDRIGA